MKIHIKLFSVAAILISFGFYQALAPQTNGQVMFKTSADQPGTGTAQQTEDDSGNETIYIVAGLAVAAVIGYALYKKFKKSEEEDSTSTNSSTYRLLENERNSFVNKVQEIKEKMPVDFFFAVKNQNITIPDRTYSVGLSFKF